MSGKMFIKRIVCLVLIIMLMSVDPLVSTAVLTFETQYDYEEANVAWLTDLVVKEDMTTVEGMAQRVDLIPRPEYPYTETPESFAKDVSYFISLYDLDTGSQKAGYIYFFEVLNSKSEILAGDVSDADIKDYLEGMGITYPSDPGADELIMARALFSAIATGSFPGDSFTSGVALEEVLVSFVAGFTGMNVESLKEWMPDSSILSLDDYILAASRLALWTNGYDVSVDTPEEEIYRLVAVMTVKEQGITVDSDLSFEELNLKYMAVLLSAKYDVSVDGEKLGSAIENDNAPFYMLQLIGKKNGLSIREDNATYEEAFSLVADNSDDFDVDETDFYADIYLYDAYLTNRCSSLWIYPTAYSTGRESVSLIVSVNGTAINNNYYNEIAIDPEKEEQELNVVVTVIENGVTYSCCYTIRVHQGTYAGIEGDKPVTDGDTSGYVPSDKVISDVLTSFGISADIIGLLNGSVAMPEFDASDVVAYFTPTFGESSSSQTVDESFYISVLDEIGSVADFEIEGLGGLSVLDEIKDGNYTPVSFG